jgi:hypothetical protein
MKKDAPNGLNLSPEDLKALAARCVELVDQGNAERQQLEARWDRNEAFFDGVPLQDDAEMPYGLGACHHSPLTKPRIVALADHVVGIIASQRPMIRCTLRGTTNRANAVEDTLQFFNDGARLKPKLKQLAIQAALFGVAIMRPRFEAVLAESYQTEEGVDVTPYGEFRTLGLVYDSISPRDFVLCNSRHCGIMTSPMVGHRFVRTRAEIDGYVEEGRYIEGDLSGAMDENPDHYRQQSTEGATQAEDFIECYELYLRCMGGDKPWFKAAKKEGAHWVRVTLAYDTNHVLAVEAWTPSRPPYIDFRLSDQPDNRFWPESSVANDLQGLQIQYNQILNTVRNGAMMAAFPAVLTDGAASGSQKIRPGAVVSVNAADKTPLVIRFDPGAMVGLIELIERQADSIVGVSQAGMAIQFSGDRTATEAAAVQAGQANRLGGYIEQFGSPLEALADYATELLYLSADLWGEIYGEEVALEREEDLIAPARWSTSARGSFDTPAAIIAKGNQLLEMTQLVGPMLNIEEVVRTIVNAMELPNADQIMPEPEEMMNASGAEEQGMGIPPELLEMAAGAPQMPAGGDLAGAIAALAGGDFGTSPVA